MDRTGMLGWLETLRKDGLMDRREAGTKETLRIDATIERIETLRKDGIMDRSRHWEEVKH